MGIESLCSLGSLRGLVNEDAAESGISKCDFGNDGISGVIDSTSIYSSVAK
jgi:hypothetical protein